MVYTKTVWVASTAPGISATNLNNLETQYDEAVVYSTTYMAPLASPPFTGTPNAPTAAFGTDSTQLATCEYVWAQLIGSTASNTVHASDASTYSQANATPILKATLTRIPPQYMNNSEFRIKCTMKSGTAGQYAFAIIGGVTFSTDGAAYGAEQTQDVELDPGTPITVYLYCSVGHTGYVKDISICGTDTTGYALTW